MRRYDRPIEVKQLTPQEVEALKLNGMYWCTSEGDECDAEPVYRVSEVMGPGETVLNILAHLCPEHAEGFLRGEVPCDNTPS